MQRWLSSRKPIDIIHHTNCFSKENKINEKVFNKFKTHFQLLKKESMDNKIYIPQPKS